MTTLDSTSVSFTNKISGKIFFLKQIKKRVYDPIEKKTVSMVGW
jgi:hypothetical protein